MTTSQVRHRSGRFTSGSRNRPYQTPVFLTQFRLSACGHDQYTATAPACIHRIGTGNVTDKRSITGPQFHLAIGGCHQHLALIGTQVGGNGIVTGINIPYETAVAITEFHLALSDQYDIHPSHSFIKTIFRTIFHIILFRCRYTGFSCPAKIDVF